MSESESRSNFESVESQDPELAKDLLEGNLAEVLSASPDPDRQRAVGRRALEAEIVDIHSLRQDDDLAARETGDIDHEQAASLTQSQLSAEIEKIESRNLSVDDGQ